MRENKDKKNSEYGYFLCKSFIENVKMLVDIL